MNTELPDSPKELFFGQNLTDYECEKITLKRFGGGERAFKKAFKLELQLQQSKWFDYRILHPIVATYLYAHEYTLAFRRYYSMTIDYERGQYVRGFKGSDALLSTNSGAFFKGRQQADRMGIPYDFYISSAMKFLYVKKWKHIARPCHLYAEDVIERVEARWVRYTSATLVLARSDFFKDAANVETPELAAHREWIRCRLENSKIRDLALESVVEQGYIV